MLVRVNLHSVRVHTLHTQTGAQIEYDTSNKIYSKIIILDVGMQKQELGWMVFVLPIIPILVSVVFPSLHLVCIVLMHMHNR